MLKILVLPLILFPSAMALAKDNALNPASLLETASSAATILSSPSSCRDFKTISDFSLPICDFITADKLKTDLLTSIILEQKNIDQLLLAPQTISGAKENLVLLKTSLSLIEQHATKSVLDICNFKGFVLNDGKNLVAGCFYNELQKIKFLVTPTPLSSSFVISEKLLSNQAEQNRFDNLINDVLLDLAEKNKTKYPDSIYEKTLMIEILKIYGFDGQNLYNGFLGICILDGISKTSAGQPLDLAQIMNCQEIYLNDVKRTILDALNK